MGLEIREPNTCIRGCCRSESIPLHLLSSVYSLSSPIAQGSESVVYVGTLDGQRVAIKKPILSTSEDMDRFHRELQLLCKLDHPRIAKFLAAHAKPPNYLFFYKLYESGNLADKLHVEEWSPSIEEALVIIVQLAEALQYLHNLGVVHRDVKPRNILMDENGCPHLGDFGLAAYTEDLKHVSVENWRSSGKPTGGFHKENMVGTLIYMAPEILKKEKHSEKSDVYSFAVTVNELLTGVVPYTDLRTEAQAHTVLEMNYTEQQLTAAVVSEGLRPVLAGAEMGVPASLSSLINRCWGGDPNCRPSFCDILAELDSILQEVSRFEKDASEAVHATSSNDESIKGSKVQVYKEKINWSTQGTEILKDVTVAIDSGPKICHQYSGDVMAYCPVLSWGSFATCGQRETMEDTHFLMPQILDEKDIHLFGIFDGHRGGAAAEFSVQALPIILQSLCSTMSPSEALLKAFIDTDDAFRNALVNHKRFNSIEKDSHPGCTAIAVLVVRNKMYVANAGDCRAILCRNGNAIALSQDHVASCVEERERIIRAGGKVKWQVDTWRVGAAALQVTRSIGDDDLKPAVTAEPEITEICLSSADEYLVMASDGLWDVMNNEEVISIVKNTVKDPGMCSKRLATEAAARGSKDNITVILVFLQPVTTAERIY